MCMLLFIGLTCDARSLECNGSPCLYGRCVDVAGVGLTCVCNLGYAGNYYIYC